MSDLLERIKLYSVWIGKDNSQEIIDLIEQQQARIAELEHRAEEAEGKLSIVLDKHGQPDPYKCVVYDLTPLEAEKKLQDSIKRLGWLPPDEAAALRQERDELAATVERLREQLSAMAAQHQCGCGHPACNRCRDDEDNREALRETTQQNLNAIKCEVAREAFIAGAKDAVAFISQQLRLGKTDIDLDAGLAADKYIERVKDGE